MKFPIILTACLVPLFVSCEDKQSQAQEEYYKLKLAQEKEAARQQAERLEAVKAKIEREKAMEAKHKEMHIESIKAVNVQRAEMGMEPIPLPE